jgi:uncharacterized protein
MHAMTLVPRILTAPLLTAASQYPVVTITGPRQSGKTTLCRMAFPGLAYVSLEPIDFRLFAEDDPRGFLSTFTSGAILDEVQRAPDLLSYVHEAVDADPTPGRFVLTGSEHLGLSRAVAQSLAGRSAVFHLLPMSFDELSQFPSPPAQLHEVLWQGGYPRIEDRDVPPGRWLADYVTTYVERDVRQVSGVTDLATFSGFVRLAAGRSGQELNLSSLGQDVGVSHNTIRSWLSVMEATFLVALLPPWHTNFRKRFVKAPKIHFIDAGLAAHLIRIERPDQVLTHPHRGALFETWAVNEIRKWRMHRGLAPRMYHYREARGVEIDVIVETADRLLLVEIKSGMTVHSSWFRHLSELKARLRSSGDSREVETRLIYGGDQARTQEEVKVVPWAAIHEYDW